MPKRKKKGQGAAAKAPKKGKAAAAAACQAATATAAPAPAPAPAAPAPAPAASPAASPSKPEKGALSDETKKLFQDLAKLPAAGTKLTPSDFDGCKVNDFKVVLKLNDRPTTGNRTDLMNNVIEYMTEGCPPRCPECGGGRLRFGKPKKSTPKKQYYCPGYMEDDEFVNCGFRRDADSGDVTRLPWKSP